MSNLSVSNQKGLEQEKVSFSMYMNSDKVKSLLNRSIGKNYQSFITSIVTAVGKNPELNDCVQSSILASGLLGESLKLSPSPQLGQYYMVPFKDKKKGKVATFVLGYKGYIQLAIRSGQYKHINVLELKEGEVVDYNPLSGEIEVRFMTNQEERERAETCGYYAMFELINGFVKSEYWTKDKMLRHADRYSPAFSLNGTSGDFAKVSYADYLAKKYPTKDEWKYSSFWYKDFDGMAKKTMIRQLISKWGVMSIDMQTAYLRDESVSEMSNDGGIDVVDVFSESNEEITEVSQKIENKGNFQPDASDEKANNENVTKQEQEEFDFFA